MPDDELEDQLLDEEDERRREELELAAKDQQELTERLRRRDQLAAQADANRAIELARAHADEVAATNAFAERDRARSVAAEKLRQLNLERQTATGRDDPEAWAIQDAADRRGRTAAQQEDLAGYEERRARRYVADARDHRAEAARPAAEPPPVEAVRKPPSEMPEATKFRRNEHELKRKRREKSPLDLDLGE